MGNLQLRGFRAIGVTSHVFQTKLLVKFLFVSMPCILISDWGLWCFPVGETCLSLSYIIQPSALSLRLFQTNADQTTKTVQLERSPWAQLINLRPEHTMVWKVPD